MIAIDGLSPLPFADPYVAPGDSQLIASLAAGERCRLARLVFPPCPLALTNIVIIHGGGVALLANVFDGRDSYALDLRLGLDWTLPLHTRPAFLRGDYVRVRATNPAGGRVVFSGCAWVEWLGWDP